MHDSEQGHPQAETEPEQRAERPPQARPRIYVASLSDYNAGRLYGVWLEAAQEVEELQAGITAMLETSPEPVAEEWAIHDYEGFGRMHLSEYESLETVSAVAQGIVEHGPAFAAWADLQYPLDVAALADFEAAFRGTWKSVEAYAEDLRRPRGHCRAGADSGVAAALRATRRCGLCPGSGAGWGHLHGAGRGRRPHLRCHDLRRGRLVVEWSTRCCVHAASLVQ